MKAKTILSLAAGVLLLAGCAATFRPWKLDEVQKGMSRDEVTALLGKPNSVEQKDGAEILYYVYQPDYNPSPAVGDTTRDLDSPSRQWEDAQIKQSLNKRTYAIKLVNGKVVECKLVKEERP